jgi:haloalkane dehalogenase
MSLPERRVLPSVGEVVRTPDSRFDAVVGYDWPVHDVVVGDGLHLSYVDAGPHDATETMLLLHGEPTWGYLYHKMVGPLVAAGYRVIVPDLIGFGRSDKPTDELAYTYSSHVAWIREMVENLNLTNVTFFGQDWGGLIGSRVIAEIPERFARLVFSNTGLPRSGPGVPFINAQERLDPKFVLDNLGMDWRAAVNSDDSINSELVHAIVEAGPSFYFLAWRLYAQEVADVVPSKIIPGWCLSDVSPESLAAYDAPFPTQEFAAGARRFPMLVPITLDDPERLKGDAAWEVYSTFTKPVLTLWGDRCPFTYVEMGQQFREGIPGAQLSGIQHKVFRASHFIQEDLGPEMAAEMVSFVKQFPLPQ